MKGGRLSLTTGNALTQPAAHPTATATTQRRGDQRKTAQVNRVGEKCGDDSGQRNQRADREIDASGDDDERLPDAQHAVVRDLPQHANDVARF